MKKSKLVAAAMSALVLGALPAQAARTRARTTTESYSTPYLGHPEVYGMCMNDMGCTRFGVGTKERFVTVEVSDDVGLDAYGYVVQSDDEGVISSAVICGRSTEAIPIEPSIEVRVLLSPVTGTENPCPSVATSGEVTATFSARR